MNEALHFRARRQALSEHMMDNSMAVLAAAPAQYRNSDTEYPYRQDSCFYYLTGIDESDAVVLMIKTQGKLHYVVFCQVRDKKIEQWTGRRIGIDDMKAHYGADEAYPITEMSSYFVELLAGISTVYYLIHANPLFDKKLLDTVETLRHKMRSGVESPFRFVDLRVLLGEMRLIKRPEEIEALQKACDISVNAHIQAMRHCRAGMFEYELEAELLHEFYRQGSRFPAYSSIVAGGANACVLHYTKNNARLKENALVLIDAGAEYDYYAADITRTFPVSGKFTAEQQAIYELVLASQMSAIESIRPGITWDTLQQQILKVLISGLVDLKILKGDPETLMEEKAHFPFYMHNSGHWLGMDVHDVGDYKVNHQWRKLMPGMVFTVEPGLYFSEDNLSIPEKYRGIGVRIEDDLLVTEQGYQVLTQNAPKTVLAIEEAMKEK